MNQSERGQHERNELRGAISEMTLRVTSPDSENVGAA